MPNLRFKNRVKDSTTTTGTGDITLSGTAPTTYQSFNTAFGTSVYFCYGISGGGEWEVGIGHLSAATTLVRDSVIESTNSNTLVNFSAGTKDVICTLPASLFDNVYTDAQLITALTFSSGATLNFNSSDVIITHSANALTISGGDLALGANNLALTGSIASTGSRVLKGWFTDLEVTNAIVGSITGNAATVTTNANLTGDVTSVGNATTIAASAVTLAKMANLAANSVIGNSTGGATTPAAISMVTTATGNSVALRDTNGSLSAVNYLAGYATTATAAGTTTLTVASAFNQFFTGTTTHTVRLPVATTLVNGQSWYIVNNSTGAVTVQTSGTNTLVILAAGTKVLVTCKDTAGGTGTASWDYDYSGASVTSAKKLSVSNTMTLSAADDTGVYTFPTGTKTLVATDVATLSSLASIGTITTGTWQGSIISSTYGGTGVNNAGRTLTISSNSGTITFGAASKTLTINNSLGFTGTDSTTMTFPAASTTIAGLGTTQTFTGINTFTPAARSSGVASYLTINMPSDTGQTTATESIGVNFAAGTRTWADGTTTLQREHVFAAPTYNKTTTSATFTTAVNVDIANPVAGTGVTITNNYGLRVVDMQATGKINNITFTQPATAAVLTLAAGKTVTINNTLTLAGTDSTTMTFPSTTGTVATLDATQTFTNKTLTAPKFADLGFIADANGNEMIIFDTVASAVNEITLANAATANNPKISATGGDANIGIDFQVKGTGVYRFLSTSSNSAILRIYEDTDAGSNYVGLTVASSLAADYTVTLPSATTTLIGADTTDTLTNKTWQGVVINSTYGGTGVNNAGRTLTVNTNSGTIAFGAASKTLTINNTLTLAGTDSTTMTFPSTTGTVATLDATQTFTNKTLISTTNVVEEISTTTSSSTPTPTGGSLRNFFTVTALAASATFAAPSGSPASGNRLLIRIKDNGGAQTLAWNAIYRAIAVTLPTTTTASKTTYVGCVYNSADSKWDVIAVGTEA